MGHQTVRSVSCYQMSEGHSTPPESQWPEAGVKLIESLAKRRWGSGRGSALTTKDCACTDAHNLLPMREPAAARM